MIRIFLAAIMAAFFCPLNAASLLCFGDSQTQVRPPLVASETYCYKMAQATGRTALNAGVGGNTSTMGLARLQTDVLATSAECVAVMFGANDAYIDYALPYNYSSYWTEPKPSRVPLTTFRDNLASMVTQIQAGGKQVTLITPWAFWSTESLQQFPFYVNAVKQVGKELGVPVLDAYAIQLNLWWASQPWLPASSGAPSFWALEQDYQHPSALGHTKIAELCTKPENAASCACSQ